MIATAAVLLALAGAAPSTDPAQAAPVEVLAQHDATARSEHAVEATGYGRSEAAEHEGCGAGHGAAGGEEELDYIEHIQDSREWELPFGKVVCFPAAGTYMLGPIDMTPTKHVMFMGIAGLLTILCLLGGARLASRAERGVTAGKRHNAIEAMVLFIRDEVVVPNIGHGGEKYAPFVCTLFFFILFCNLLGIIPWGSTATASVSVTAALAVITFVVAEIGGLIAVGPKQYLGTIYVVPKGMGKVSGHLMAMVLSPIELVGKLTRPFALCIRLMANMTAGHIVLLALISLIFVFGSWVVLAGPVLMAVAISFLEIFVAFLQAYIFAMLTSVFIGLARHAH
ncbi:MAG TPA: F0F1 ATP synthase subunit A [Longimicrobium sp.]|jgi:F-type H+-transporting ATPase subunit a